MADKYPYRVFVCYASEDIKVLDKVLEQLSALGLCPRWSGTLHAGTPYPEQIKEEISRAHVFLPILTKHSSSKPWVHQEIGFAVAANVPVLPVAIDCDIPEGFAHELQAVRVMPVKVCGGEEELRRKLTYERFDAAVRLASAKRTAFFSVAPFVEDRTRMLVEAAAWLENVGQYVKVRQWATFTSFSLPDVDYFDRQWPDCDGCEHRCNRALRRDWRRERQALERHGRTAGCDLLIDPHALNGHPERAQKVRARVLLNFLTSVRDDPHVRAIVIPPPKPGERTRSRGNRTLLGDWFAADSITPLPGLGYEQTLATWHAPTVLDRMREFDGMFCEYLAGANLDDRPSTHVAIERLEKLYPPGKSSDGESDWCDDDPEVRESVAATKSKPVRAKRGAANGKVSREIASNRRRKSAATKPSPPAVPFRTSAASPRKKR